MHRTAPTGQAPLHVRRATNLQESTPALLLLLLLPSPPTTSSTSSMLLSCHRELEGERAVHRIAEIEPHPCLASQQIDSSPACARSRRIDKVAGGW